MDTLKGHFLVPTHKNLETGLWVIFHHEADGILAFDITQEHPDIPFDLFKKEAADRVREKTVLRGGPLQDDSALILLHNRPGTHPDDKSLTDAMAFLSYRFRRIKGKPRLERADETETQIQLPSDASALIVVGFRLWEMADLETQLKEWQWYLLPATPELVFNTLSSNRLQKARLSIN